MKNLRKPKKYGIKGRSSSLFIEYRLELCRELLTSLAPTSKQDFIITYERALKDKGITNIPTRQTLSNDIKKIGYNFKNGTCFNTMPDTSSNFRNMASSLKDYLKQLRISYTAYEKKLFDANNIPNGYNLNDFSSVVENCRLEIQDIDTSISKNENIVHLYIILNTYGMEAYIAENFRNVFFLKTDYLFISAHINCVEIAFEYKDWSPIFDIIIYLIATMDFIDTP